jgi:hypothetical protein
MVFVSYGFVLVQVQVPKQHKARRQNKKKEEASERTSTAEKNQRRKHQGKKKRERRERKKNLVPRNEVASHKRQPLHQSLKKI